MKPENRKDLMIVGGGPAGLTALIWSAELGLDAVLLEAADSVGGQLRSIHTEIRNYPGLAAENGREFLTTFTRGLADFEERVRTGAEVLSFSASDKEVTLAGGETIRAGAVILATGVRRRHLGIPGEREYAGRGVLVSGAAERRTVEQKQVTIIGGGDSAVENALILAKHAARVMIVHRGKRLGARSEFLGAAKMNPRIEIMLETEAVAIGGAERVDWIDLKSNMNGVTTRIKTDAVLVRIGVDPNTELARGQLDIDEKGYLITGPVGNTSVKGIFAAGDVASPVAPTIVTAAGMGAAAAKAAYEFLTRDMQP